jgi:hypothetical protein
MATAVPKHAHERLVLSQVKYPADADGGELRIRDEDFPLRNIFLSAIVRR